MKRNIIQALLFTLLCGFPSLGSAYVTLPIKMETLSQDAKLIFRGICKELREETRNHPQTEEELPVTVYTFQVEEVIKGEVEGVFELVQLGLGYQEALQKKMAFAGRERLDCNQKEYLLFLSSPNAIGIRNILGGHQGTLKVEAEEKGAIKEKEKMIFLPKEWLKKEELTQKKIPYKNFVDSIKKAIQSDSEKK